MPGPSSTDTISIAVAPAAGVRAGSTSKLSDASAV